MTGPLARFSLALKRAPDASAIKRPQAAFGSSLVTSPLIARDRASANALGPARKTAAETRECGEISATPDNPRVESTLGSI